MRRRNGEYLQQHRRASPFSLFSAFWPASQAIFGIFLLFFEGAAAKTAKIYILCERRRREECGAWESPATSGSYKQWLTGRKMPGAVIWPQAFCIKQVNL
jgi:hypothetical protein